jgi:hypothetical protein
MLLKFWGCITRMSDLITFPLSQLARALGTVPLPGRGMGPDSITPLINNGENGEVVFFAVNLVLEVW